MTTKTARYTIEGTYYTAGILSIDPLTCGGCGVAFGMERSMLNARKKDGHLFYCPIGHGISYNIQPEVDRLKAELAESQKYTTSLNGQLDETQASLRATKGVVTRMKNRAVKGECTICGVHVYQLSRHMGRAHPDEVLEPETDAT